LTSNGDADEPRAPLAALHVTVAVNARSGTDANCLVRHVSTDARVRRARCAPGLVASSDRKKQGRDPVLSHDHPYAARV
jgi:hypothetical protein